MPCYIRAANTLGISVPDKTDQQRLEEILRKELKITDRSHEKLTEVIQKSSPRILKNFRRHSYRHARSLERKAMEPGKIGLLQTG